MVLVAVCLIQSVLAATPAVKPASNYVLQADQGVGRVEFDALGTPSALKIKGKGDAPKGALKISGNRVTGALSFELDTLDTGIKLRNEHMKKKYLETEKFPKATLTLSDWKLPDALMADQSKAENVPFEGTLLLHGVEKKISGVSTVERKAGKMDVFATFPLKTGEFGISTPSFAGITMAEDVNVSVQISAPVVVQTQ